MYQIYRKILSDETCDKIINKITNEYFKKEKTHFVREGKEFFFKNISNLKLLKEVVQKICERINFEKFDNSLYIDHAFLLLKPGGGNATTCHQDRPFWIKKEINNNQVSMFTCWVALEQILENKGCLLVYSEKEVDIKSFNTINLIFNHKDNRLKSGNFSWSIDDSRIDANKLRSVEVSKGDIVAFDAFEVHSSTNNITDKHRLSFKIVFRRGNGLINVKNFLNNFYLCSLYLLIIYNFKKLLSFILNRNVDY
jgi:ectoine hydroxylase-related dioxygenase (phytanoyl-CoA dioxygenase family)